MIINLVKIMGKVNFYPNKSFLNVKKKKQTPIILLKNFILSRILEMVSQTQKKKKILTFKLLRSTRSHYAQHSSNSHARTYFSIFKTMMKNFNQTMQMTNVW
ncbi:hypothetical protein C1646_700656 [Rhizophagus diaphanus]|nr:hypothetical protein C1646_700656 [Rhizophagus diaphanus] [Rhizophagus sp. MUCL 43196]